MLMSCNGFFKWDIKELYIQRIEGSSKVIYKYDAWRGFDAHSSGFIILDSTEHFSVNYNKKLPFYYLSNIPNHNSIQGVKTICVNSCGDEFISANPIYMPIKNEVTHFEGIETISNIYQYKGFADKSKGLSDLQFSTYLETRDSLYFYNLNYLNDTLKFKDSVLVLPKGEVIIQHDVEANVRMIRVEYMNLNINNKEIVSHETYFLTPKSPIKSTSFSNYGIFKTVH